MCGPSAAIDLFSRSRFGRSEGSRRDQRTAPQHSSAYSYTWHQVDGRHFTDRYFCRITQDGKAHIPRDMARILLFLCGSTYCTSPLCVLLISECCPISRKTIVRRAPPGTVFGADFPPKRWESTTRKTVALERFRRDLSMDAWLGDHKSPSSFVEKSSSEIRPRGCGVLYKYIVYPFPPPPPPATSASSFLPRR